MQNSNFLKYHSKSEKDWFQLTDILHLNPTDVLVMQYLMHMFKNSTAHGKNGKNGNCYYRHDSKITGFYVSGHYSQMANDIHAEITGKTVQRSLNRLQSKGILYHHHSYDHVQIYLPIFDNDVRESFNDPNYKTIINCSKIGNGQIVHNVMDKMSITKRTNCPSRKGQNVHHRNVPVNNKPLNNKPLSNVHNSNEDKQTNQGLPKWIYKNLNESIASYLIKYSKDVLKSATNIIDNIYNVNRHCLNIKGTKEYKAPTNTYIHNGKLLEALKKDNPIETDYKNYLKDHGFKFINHLKKNTYHKNKPVDKVKEDKAYTAKTKKAYANSKKTSPEEIKKLELEIAEDNIQRNSLEIKPEKFVRIQNSILKKLKDKNKNIDECDLNGKAIKLTVKHIQNQAKPSTDASNKHAKNQDTANGRESRIKQLQAKYDKLKKRFDYLDKKGTMSEYLSHDESKEYVAIQNQLPSIIKPLKKLKKDKEIDDNLPF